jgi:hypothetical protein
MKRLVATAGVACALFVPAALFAPSASPASSPVVTSFYVNGGYLGQIRQSYAGRWDIYYSGQHVGYLRSSYTGRWNIYMDYLLVGYMRKSYSGRWNVYIDYVPVGYIRSFAARSYAFYDYSPVGSAIGPAAPLGAGAVVALVALGRS